MCVYINMSICFYVFKEQWSLLCEDLMSACPGVLKAHLYSLTMD